MLLDFKKQLDQIQNSINTAYENITTFEVNLSDLENSYIKINFELKKMQKHCLYWFEAESIEEAEMLVTLLDTHRILLKDITRAVPPKSKNTKSKVIYLGVRQGGKPRKKDGGTNFGGRIYHHFGLYEKGTQGLQLNHWANTQKNNLLLNVIELEIESIQHLYIIEKIFSVKLNPLLGRH